MSGISLNGKTALVTGGASGIGASVVNLLRELGATVCVADSNTELPRGNNELVLSGDVSLQQDTQRLVAEAIERMGTIDILVNSAGIADTITATIDQDVSSWQRIVDVDLTGSYLMCKAAGAHMVARGSGAIVNIASVVGLGGFPRRNAYGASKAGLIMLTRSLACEWGNAGVRVNCVAPAYIRTPLVASLIDGGKIDVDRVERRTPMARMGDPLEVARAVAYLSSDWASYVTGTTLTVDGGWMAFSGAGDVATA